MKALNKWFLWFAATIVGVVICYFWLDKPIAFFVHTYTKPLHLPYEFFTLIPEWVVWLNGPVMVVLGLCFIAGKRLNRLPTTIFLAGLSITLAGAFKSGLKDLCGRTWPETWSGGNVSLIHDGVYGFFPLHGGIAYASFPSGHMATMFGLISVLWICYPRFRGVYLTVSLLVAAALLLTNYHFLGDLIAGSLVGISAGWMVTAVWKNGYREMPRVSS